jgi:5-dehydro-2-deoxygluconokinase
MTETSSASAIDLLCVGRICVDLYGEQPGAGLASSDTFVKSVGGSSTNICVGTSRLGLRTAMCSRVGEEPLGHFCVDWLAANGVDISAMQFDPERLTGLIVLALYQGDDFPRVFYYRESADLAFDPAGFDFEFATRCRAIMLAGSYLSRPALHNFSVDLARAVREAGGRVALDIDYRPVLWGEAPIGRGQEMTGGADHVTAAYRELLPLCDLIVGTEDEVRVATGEEDLAAAVQMLADESTVVMKRGALGAVAYPDELSVAGFDIEVQNTVGAGDGFMSGFLSRWLRDAPLEECLRAGNAGGAIVAARRGAMSALAYEDELDSFLQRGGVRRPDSDEEIERLHRVGGRRPTPEHLFVLAVDHRRQLEEMAVNCSASVDRLPALKELFVDAFFTVAAQRNDVGVLLDAQYGSAGLERLDGAGHRVFRPIEISGSRPVEWNGGPDLSSELRTWPSGQTIKVMVFMSHDDEPELTALQTARLATLSEVARRLDRELLVELQIPNGRPYDPGELEVIVAGLYGFGVRPEWWKLPGFADSSEWLGIGNVVRAADPSCRGFLALGGGASAGELAAEFGACVKEPLARGFAVGRTIFAVASEAWLSGNASDAETVDAVAAGFLATIALWEGP